MRDGLRLLPVLLAIILTLAVPAGAGGQPRVPTASVTPIIYGTQGANGWYVTDITVNWVLSPWGTSSPRAAMRGRSRPIPPIQH